MSAHQFQQHVRVSSTEDLSYIVAPKGEISDTIQTIVTGRKCWKTMKGKGEVVWPPYLEAALVEGLEKYQPVESRTSRAPGRFPMRNKFISDYIYNTTGKRRTPKQVGSRLQQLRDTTEGKRILQLLSNRHTAMMSSSKPSTSEYRPSIAPSASPSTSFATPAAPTGPPCSYVTIEVLPSTGGAPLPALTPLTTSPLAPFSCPSIISPAPAYQSPGPRPLRAIDPTVTFLARAPLTAHARFRVQRGGQTVHEERAELALCASSCAPQARPFAEMECTFLYRTRLVPGYWHALCECRDPTPYTIIQEIVRTTQSLSSLASVASTSTAPTNAEETLLSVVYQFTNPFATPPLSPTSSGSGSVSAPGDGGDSSGSGFSAESSPDLSPDFGNFMMLSSMHPTGSGVPLPLSQAGGLMHHGEDGYASVPPSPLDLAPDAAEWKYGALAVADALQPHAHGHHSQSQGQSALGAGMGCRDFLDFAAPHYSFGAAVFPAPV